jgi:hypothetical protein
MGRRDRLPRLQHGRIEMHRGHDVPLVGSRLFPEHADLFSGPWENDAVAVVGFAPSEPDAYEIHAARRWHSDSRLAVLTACRRSGRSVNVPLTLSLAFALAHVLASEGAVAEVGVVEKELMSTSYPSHLRLLGLRPICEVLAELGLG